MEASTVTVQSLRQFISERLTAAASEILGVCETTIAKYEDEIDRQRRLFDIICKPRLKLHRTELPQLQLCDEESSLGPHQEEPEPLQIKEEQEESCTSQEGEQLVLKLEDDQDDLEFVLNPGNDEDSLSLNPTSEESPHREPEPSDSHLVSQDSPAAQRQDLSQGTHAKLRSTSCEKPASDKTHHILRKQMKHNIQKCKSTASNISSNNCKVKKVFKCDTCGKVFKWKCRLLKHAKVHTDEKPFSCKTCGKGFKFRGSVKIHMRVHTGEKPFSCNMCEKSFALSSSLKIHMRTHTGEKPFCCKICGRTFTFSGSWRTHVTTHTNERPFSCKTCGKSFTSTGGLQYHVRKHSVEKSDPCAICGKTLSSRSQLKLHLRIHTGEKPYSCKTCGKEFRFSSLYRNHMRTHSDEKPFVCNVCGKRFVLLSSLKQHQNSHPDKMQHTCGTCGEIFRIGSELETHIRHTHPHPKLLPVVPLTKSALMVLKLKAV